MKLLTSLLLVLGTGVVVCLSPVPPQDVDNAIKGELEICYCITVLIRVDYWSELRLYANEKERSVTIIKPNILFIPW